MSVKSEPMDFDQESQAPLVIPTHLVINSTVSDDMTVMQTTTPDVMVSKQTHNSSNETLTSREHLHSDQSAARPVAIHSKFDNSLKARVHASAKTVHPSFTIDREEIELNSKLLPKKYMCGFCVYKTSYKSDLNRHLRRHNQESNFHCQLCNMPFRTEGLVYHHIRTAHGRHLQLPSASRYACDVCHKSFVDQTLMVQHKASVHGIINYPSQFDGCSSGGIRSSEAASRYQKSPVTIEDSLRPSSYETVDVEDDYLRSSSYCSEEDLGNGVSSVKGEVSNDCPESRISPIAQGLPECESGDRVSFRSRFAETGSPRDNMPGVQLDASLMPSSHTPDPDTVYSDHAGPSVGRNGTNELTQSLESKESLVYSKNGISPNKSAGYDSYEKPVPHKQNESVSVTFAPQNRHYSCERCGLIFKTLNGILNHKLSCKSEGLGFVKACSLCPFQSSNDEAFAVHCEKHSLAPYCCEVCNKPFVALQNLMKHKRFVHRNVSQRSVGFSGSSKKFNRTRFGLSSLKRAGDSTSIHRKQNGGVPDQRMYYHNRSNVTNTFPCDSGRNQFPGLLSSPSNPEKTVVTSQPPESGRYAKLVSDFDDFAARPYACALCFFRTSDVTELSQHAKNHLTGCNTIPVPETARFITSRNNKNHLTEIEIPSFDSSGIAVQTISRHHIHEQTIPDREFDNINDDETGKIETFFEHETTNDNKIVKRRKALRKYIKGRNHLRRYPFGYKSDLPGNARFPCVSCDKSFSLRILLTRHVKNTHRSTIPGDDAK